MPSSTPLVPDDSESDIFDWSVIDRVSWCLCGNIHKECSRYGKCPGSPSTRTPGCLTPCQGHAREDNRATTAVYKQCCHMPCFASDKMSLGTYFLHVDTYLVKTNSGEFCRAAAQPISTCEPEVKDTWGKYSMLQPQQCFDLKSTHAQLPKVEKLHWIPLFTLPVLAQILQPLLPGTDWKLAPGRISAGAFIFLLWDPAHHLTPTKSSMVNTWKGKYFAPHSKGESNGRLSVPVHTWSCTGILTLEWILIKHWVQKAPEAKPFTSANLLNRFH